MSKINKRISIKRIVNKRNVCNECSLDAVFRVKLTTVTKYRDGDQLIVKKTPHGGVDLCEGHLDRIVGANPVLQVEESCQEWVKENRDHLESIRF